MRTDPGHHVPPPDRIAPLFDEIFPDKWKSGQPANRYVADVLGSDVLGSSDKSDASDADVDDPDAPT
jgi:hypothetical protein